MSASVVRGMTKARLPIIKANMKGLVSAVGAGMLAVACAAPQSENQEIVDNLIRAGFPPEDIQIVDDLVYVGRDAQVSLAASREMLRVPESSKEQYRTTNLVSRDLKKICIDGSTFSGKFGTALDLAIENYNEQQLSFAMARTPASGCDFTINAVIQPGLEGGEAGFPSNGLPFGTITIGGALSTYIVDTIAHVVTHELGHTIGFRHSDFFNRSISCGSGGSEGDAGIGAIHVPGTPTGATVGGSIMNACFRDVETGEFSGSDVIALKELYSPPPRKSDIVWRNNGSGDVTVWVMNDTSISTQVVVTGAGVVGLDWQIQGVGDFNNDGHSDILWRNTSGEVQLWLMNGTTISSATTVTAPGVVGAEWQIQGVGDFNADSKSDILWRNNTTTEVKVWLMNGASIVSTPTVTAPGVVEPEWQIRGVGDFNGDLKSDILWRNNSTSEVKVWLMNGGTITSTPIVTGPGVTELAWQSQGVGDFNGDEKSDIVWRNTSGEVKVWLMNGGTISSSTTVSGPGVVGSEWQIDEIGDFNGNNTSDLLWRNVNNGETKIWLMNGAAISTQATVTAPGVVGLDWQAQGTGDFGP